MLPTIAVAYVNSIPDETFTDFRRLVEVKGLELRVESRDADGPFAGIEWLIPTAVMVFISKAYFETFLKEIGKDHYAMLKAGLKSLYAKLLGPDAPKVIVVSTAGKATTGQQYSMYYSLLAEGVNVRFKLLFRQSATAQEYEATIAAFLSFLDAYHAGCLAPDVVAELEGARVVGKTLLLAFNPLLDRVQPVDPLAGKGRVGD